MFDFKKKHFADKRLVQTKKDVEAPRIELKMSFFRRIRLSSESSSERDDFSSKNLTVTNRNFAPYESLDLSTSNREQIENSLQTLNGEVQSASCQTISNENPIRSERNSTKLNFGTFRGVFCPVALQMLSISIFIRSSLILGHSGVIHVLLQYGLCFLILLPTTLSICALATNGAIQGGGIYHLISRTLGPEFGGSIGAIFFFAIVVGNGQSVAALVEVLVETFGKTTSFNIFRSSHWWRFLYGSVINFVNFTLCLFSSSFFSLANLFIFSLILLIYFTVIISFFIPHAELIPIPMSNTYIYGQDADVYNQTKLVYAQYTGFNRTTFMENLPSNYTIDYTTGNQMSFSTIFALLFSSTTGLLAGAGTSNDLKRPDRSIPIGLTAALLFTFGAYILEMFLMAATTSRDLLLKNYLYLPDVNIWQPFVIIGNIAAVFSACLAGLFSASRLIHAIAVDEIFGSILSWISYGTTRQGNPIAALVFTFVIVECILLIGSMNIIAPIVTIFFLLAYFAVNLSCLALDLASAPNFRPSFKYFSWHTALLGTVTSIILCFIVSAIYASVAIGILIGLIAILHLRDFPRASWGSISQALIFHQIRKYLLLLDPRKEHVKFWRPKILLLVANPRSSIDLIDFVNDMKKGGLFVLGHVKKKSAETSTIDPCTQEYPYWQSLVTHMRLKAFVDLTLASSIVEGATQLIRIAGLGGLRPNTIVLGFYDNTTPEDRLRQRSFYKRRWLKSRSASTVEEVMDGSQQNNIPLNSFHDFEISAGLSFAHLRRENETKQFDVESYVQIINEGLILNRSICLARNFHLLKKDEIKQSKQKSFIDIWPVNMIYPKTSSRFDVTCLYMLQLATILCMVKPWKTQVILRVFLCIDPLQEDAIRTQEHFNDLLRQLRINAKIRLISWENVTSLLQYSSTSLETSHSDRDENHSSPFRTAFVDLNDEYIRGINSLIRQQCDHTSCVYLYLPRPPQDQRLFARYIQVLDMLSVNLPPTLFVHGVSSVTCTHL